MSESEHRSDDSLDEHLRSAIVALARPASPTGVVEAIKRRITHRRRIARYSIAAALVMMLSGGAIAAVTVTSSDAPLVSTSATKATAPTSPIAPKPGSSPGPRPRPCPPDQVEPSMATGSYCGPSPQRGNGLGADGVCTGQEAIPPCGPGVVPNQYYAYTVPGTCDGLIIFDGQRWVAELTPPTAVPDTYVWMQLSPESALRWIGPTGSVGYRPYTGQPLGA